MKRSHIPRRWRWIRGTGMVLCAILGLSFPASLFWNVGIALPDGPAVVVFAGQLALGWSAKSARPPSDTGLVFEPITEPVRFWSFEVAYGDPYWGVTLPIWIPLLVLALPTALAWWRCRWLPPGHCGHCGYNLAGNTSGVCPECGTTPVTFGGPPGGWGPLVAHRRVLLAAAGGVIAVLGIGVWIFPSIPGTFGRDADGTAHGTGRVTYRYRTGAVKLQEDYRRGKMIRSEWFKPDGMSILVTEWKDESGVGLYLREDGTIKTRMTYVNRLADGVATYYAPDGSVVGEAVFAGGARVSGYDPTPRTVPPP